MKKALIGALLVFGAFAITPKTEAQVRFGLNVNIGNQPAWRVPGYNYAQYYYLPEIETYYDVNRRQFVYMDNGRWVFSNNLPYRYRNYDLYGGNKIVVNRPNAYLQFESDRTRYGNRNYNRYNNYNRNNNRYYNRYNRKDKDRDRDDNRRRY
jgi:hypothetical protein